MPLLRIQRLGPGDGEVARRLFRTMADVFGEAGQPLGAAYIDTLLGRTDFWALAALADDEVVGGLTAHTLPMTRTEAAELFLYDLAVRPAWQRQGVGRQLVEALRAQAAEAGIADVFVPAELEDAHALDFYRALGGDPTPVVMFTFGATLRSAAPDA